MLALGRVLYLIIAVPVHSAVPSEVDSTVEGAVVGSGKERTEYMCVCVNDCVYLL